MKNSTLLLSLSGVVPSVCDAEAGDCHMVAVVQMDVSTEDGSAGDLQSDEVTIVQGPGGWWQRIVRTKSRMAVAAGEGRTTLR